MAEFRKVSEEEYRREYKKYIGEEVVVSLDGVTRNGVVSRIDTLRGLIFVLYERLEEKAYAFPEAIELGKIKLA